MQYVASTPDGVVLACGWQTGERIKHTSALKRAAAAADPVRAISLTLVNLIRRDLVQPFNSGGSSSSSLYLRRLAFESSGEF